ncbi:nuclear transport factor 2 family protein [Humibacter albus]|uniref:nuclear transport factor 2 family protein n=1 Tax=Humibacter albus TaxID=427754 RepID=UPI0003B6D696|nr:nuclear transport factor 2 family protein [Humibacter albus]
MTPLLKYIDAWIANDPDRIAAAVHVQCTITECYGPVYLGRERVREWASTWFGSGGVVHRWIVTDHFRHGDREAAQWQFECTWDGNRSAFDGATVCRNDGGLVLELREYQTTAPLYEWKGSWH